MGMAVDFNAYEMPKVGKGSDLDKNLVKAITGKVQMEIPAMTGPYAGRPHEGPWSKMAKRTAERGKMADPAPGSAEAKLLEPTVAEAEDASARSEQFKQSLDRTDAEGKIIDGRTEMARLRSSYQEARAKRGLKWTDAQWNKDDREAFTVSSSPGPTWSISRRPSARRSSRRRGSRSTRSRAARTSTRRKRSGRTRSRRPRSCALRSKAGPRACRS